MRFTNFNFNYLPRKLISFMAKKNYDYVRSFETKIEITYFIIYFKIQCVIFQNQKAETNKWSLEYFTGVLWVRLTHINSGRCM